MSETSRVRPAQLVDVPAIAQVHVDAWAETYRGLIADQILDDPTFFSARERQWTTALTDPRFSSHRVAVAEQGDLITGIAMSGPTAEEPDVLHLCVLYLLRQWHRSGSGTDLLEAVLAPGEAATLWVADPNPRAQAFYRKHRFEADGVEKVEDDLKEVHMVRPAHALRFASPALSGILPRCEPVATDGVSIVGTG
ncbi:GNAT family N-acetyltransferase [Arthrobacter agilis]|uniref:GNAT family N-acetyltransferase n=1 Tax=Arthrobacter agilis TaxID=37921 RepID=UPI000B352761|nr:GNAT family N-acetyltransferase [Arthrobacter agilis]PPB47753.1 GNAT family N-acetyltransferase [Arthrobacter agilis]TPV21640.1 GNAT family N-acetyltransferase [Arthrobacter agilis]